MDELQIPAAQFPTHFRSPVPLLSLSFCLLHLSFHRPSLLLAAATDNISVPMAAVTTA
jgi:hypothetical protein